MRRLRQTGFTLIEMLVVIVITGIVITMAMLAFGSMNKGREVKMTAEKFVRAMQAAQARSSLMPQTLGLRLKAKGYRFYGLKQNKNGKFVWRKLKEDALSSEDAFAKGMILEIKRLGNHSAENASLDKDKTIVFSQSGEITPFTLILCDRAKTVCFKVWLDNSGKVAMKSLASKS